MVIDFLTGERIVADRPVGELISLIESKAISLNDISGSELDAMMNAVIAAMHRNSRCGMCEGCSLANECDKLRAVNHGK